MIIRDNCVFPIHLLALLPGLIYDVTFTQIVLEYLKCASYRPRLFTGDLFSLFKILVNYVAILMRILNYWEVKLFAKGNSKQHNIN